MTLTQPSPSLDSPPVIPFTHEQELTTTGPRSGLIMSVAVHSTRLGQVLGSARLWQYGSWTDAVADALRVQADLLVPFRLLGGAHLARHQRAQRARRGGCGKQPARARREGTSELAARGILWAPDSVVNAGGVVYLDFASEPGAPAAITARVDAIGDTVTTIFSDARAQGITTLEVAERLAIARLDAGS